MQQYTVIMYMYNGKLLNRVRCENMNVIIIAKCYTIYIRLLIIGDIVVTSLCS